MSLSIILNTAEAAVAVADGTANTNFIEVIGNKN